MAGIVKLDKVQAIYSGNIESVKHSAVLENGMVVALGGLVAGETELREVATVADGAGLEKEEFLLHATPEVVYESGKNLKDFSVATGKAARAYHLSVGDIVTVSDDMITGTSTVGQFLIPAVNSTKLATSTDGTVTIATIVYKPRLVLKVIEKGTIGYDGTASTTAQVVKV
jgi:hypothetical protein